ncbi:armadillo BTB arabidopsis protein [Elysia marginata]|uniref:Armadillo BTB arabidopsis protein n=1 Tax=Elysia marginata TaxID=1093978 RepID=A0AAV4G346_9GAST|nr:armadillo BTB arabidopsis protein [Elysia marginata]
MIIYVQNKAFPHKTFVTSAKPRDKIARLRAQLLHILYELGKDDHLFRLRYKGQMLRDAFTLEDYEIGDNAILTMMPVGRSQEMLMEIRSMSSSEFSFDIHGQPANVKNALEDEIKTFDRRESMVINFKALLNVHLLFVFLSMLTTHWYSVFWLFLCWLLGVWFVPTYSRIGGFVGNTSHLKIQFCIGVLVLSVACLAVTLYFCISGWIFVASGDCSDWVESGHCSHKKIYTAALFTLHALALILTIVMGTFMLKNFRVDVGDLIEKFLVQERNIEQVMAMARNGKVKEKRAAAYDLAAMAASSEDNKFRIVAEGGLDVLTTMALSRDEVIQEHAVEALAELLTIPSIQDTFVESGGVRTLSAVLHSPVPRVMQEAAYALYTIVADSEDNKHAVVEDHGLDDLVHAAHEGTILCQRTVASIFLELIFNAEIRAQIASRNTPTQALVHLCKTNDPETLRFSLQSLEEDLLALLLDLPYRTMDEKLYLLAGKILLYYAENRETCEQLLSYPKARDTLDLFAKSRDAILQKVAVKIIFCCLEYPDLKAKAQHVGMENVLQYIRDHAADKDTWDMAEQSLQLYRSPDDLSGLPTLSTLEKLSKMEAKSGKFDGSQSSLGSNPKKDAI